LIASEGSEEASLRDIILDNLAGRWQPATADSFEQAHFVMQHHPCDVILVDEGLYRREGAAGLSWLTERARVPVAYLVSESPRALTEALRQGIAFCLPRSLALNDPQVVCAALDRVAELGRLDESGEKSRAELDESRRRVDRLVQMLWQAAPIDPHTRWFTQHFMLERLREELVRTGRHGSPVTIAVGEVRGGQSHDTQMPLPRWTIREISQRKRRSDVAGQYGANGFLLLLVHTTKAGGESCCRRLRQVIEEAPENANQSVHAYFGLASYSARSCTPQSLLRCAEEQLESDSAGYPEGVAASRFSLTNLCKCK
jgi:GGDEF domain-containing protein